jgi:hypothetical protein
VPAPELADGFGQGVLLSREVVHEAVAADLQTAEDLE